MTTTKQNNILHKINVWTVHLRMGSNQIAVHLNKIHVDYLSIIFVDVDNIVERVANIMTAEDQQSLSKTWRTQFEE